MKLKTPIKKIDYEEGNDMTISVTSELAVNNILEKALDASSLREKVIANNIANVNTPGFKRKEVAFEKILKEAIAPTMKLKAKKNMSRHMSFSYEVSSLNEVKGKIFTVHETSMRNDKNNIDVETESANLAKNSIFYSTAASLVAHNFRELASILQAIRT